MLPDAPHLGSALLVAHVAFASSRMPLAQHRQPPWPGKGRVADPHGRGVNGGR